MISKQSLSFRCSARVCICDISAGWSRIPFAKERKTKKVKFDLQEKTAARSIIDSMSVQKQSDYTRRRREREFLSGEEQQAMKLDFSFLLLLLTEDPINSKLN